MSTNILALITDDNQWGTGGMCPPTFQIGGDSIGYFPPSQVFV